MLDCEETYETEIIEDAGFPADPAQGYFVDYRRSTDTAIAYHHCFCGLHEVGGAWCPNCQKPLLRFLALDTRDDRLNLQDVPTRTLPLLFCWTCNVAQETFYYRVLWEAVELMEYGQGSVATDFPYEDYPAFFPGAGVVLHAVAAEEQTVLRHINRRFGSDGEETEATRKALHGQHPKLWDIRHQVGGEPFLIQGLTFLDCLVWGAAMPFLASVADDCLDPRGLVGNDAVQVLCHFCRRCCVIGAFQTTD